MRGRGPSNTAIRNRRDKRNATWLSRGDFGVHGCVLQPYCLLLLGCLLSAEGFRLTYFWGGGDGPSRTRDRVLNRATECACV